MHQTAVRAIPNNFHTLSILNRGMGGCKHIFYGKKGLCRNILWLIVSSQSHPLKVDQGRNIKLRSTCAVVMKLLQNLYLHFSRSSFPHPTQQLLPFLPCQAFKLQCLSIDSSSLGRIAIIMNSAVVYGNRDI